MNRRVRLTVRLGPIALMSSGIDFARCVSVTMGNDLLQICRQKYGYGTRSFVLMHMSELMTQ